MASYRLRFFLLITVLLLLVVNAAKVSTTPSRLWELYKNSSSSSDKIQLVNQLTHTLTDMAYVDSRIVMTGLILFGPQMDRSLLRSVRAPFVNDPKCLKLTVKLFKKHCGLQREQRLKHIRAFANMCNYVADKRAIEEAFIIVCGMNHIEPYGIDSRHPIIDVTPTPVRGSSYLCGRVSINSISRMKFENYAKSRRLLFVPSFFIPGDWRNKMVQICLHRNASLGLCQCEKDDWISVEEKLWSPVMSPFEQRYLDVKFVGVDSGFLTVTLEEESKVWRYILLAIGNVLPFMAPVFSKYLLSRDVDDRVTQFLKWATLFLAVTSIFLSSIDPHLALVAVGSCLALHCLISSIIDPILFKKTKQWLWSESDFGEDGDGDRDRWSTESHFYSTFHNIPDREKFSEKEWEEFTRKSTRKSVGELASSSEFIDWVMKKRANAELHVPPLEDPEHPLGAWVSTDS